MGMKIYALVLVGALTLGACGSADTPGSDSIVLQSQSSDLDGNASSGTIADSTTPDIELKYGDDPTLITFPSVITELKLPMGLEEFTTIATEHGYAVRVVEEDGEYLPVTADYSPQRINVVVENDQVTELSSMG